MFRPTAVTTALLCTATLACSTGAQAQSMHATLDSASAQKIVAACQTLAVKQGWHMAIAVVGEDGQLRQFQRMDGTMLIATRAAQLKAETSALLPIPTRMVREVAKSTKGLEYLPGITTVAGGLPIVSTQGQPMGAVGVSGGMTEDQDEQCAQAGLSALQ